MEVTERRTKQDFAHQMRWLVDEAYPEAGVVRVVLDNLNTHPRMMESPHPQGAEHLEFSIVSRSCLGQRLPDVCREVKALEQERNEARAVIMAFTTEDIICI